MQWQVVVVLTDNDTEQNGIDMHNCLCTVQQQSRVSDPIQALLNSNAIFQSPN